MHTYIVYLDGAYYAAAMGSSAGIVRSLTTGAVYPFRTMQERNAAFMAACSPMSWKEAHALAVRSGHYIGQLFSK